MELLFSCSTRYQEIITVYILLLDTLLVRCSRSRDNKLNIQREILYQITPKYYSLFIEWRQNSRYHVQRKSYHVQRKSNHVQRKSNHVQRKSYHVQRKSYHVQRISIRDCGAIAQWSLFIKPCNHRLLTTKKVFDECKAIKLVDKCSRKKCPGLELFNCEKVLCLSGIEVK